MSVERAFNVNPGVQTPEGAALRRPPSASDADLRYDPNAVGPDGIVRCRVSGGPRADDSGFDPRIGDRVRLVGDDAVSLRGRVTLRDGDRVSVRLDRSEGPRALVWMEVAPVARAQGVVNVHEFLLVGDEGLVVDDRLIVIDEGGVHMPATVASCLSDSRGVPVWQCRLDPDPQAAVEPLLRRIPTGYARWIGCGHGWYSLLVDVDARLAGIDSEYRLLRAGSVDGRLRLDVEPGVAATGQQRESLAAHLHAVAVTAVAKSRTLCEVCGEPGTPTTTPGGRPVTMCPDCLMLTD